ncbi:hypothetical protein [Streptomyces sp. NBC_01429]|uniref:hypothetical protein n=1 Tax=Streptomyces sp. NBC_01429 TaxID=2903862 RepID=UPI002E2D9003|nr:hypothetical protein [Streptomyces sp. NBC_01429]
MATSQSNTTYSAPVGSVDLAAMNDEGEPYEIWPCGSCLPWHAEVVQADRSGSYFSTVDWSAMVCSSRPRSFAQQGV